MFAGVFVFKNDFSNRFSCGKRKGPRENEAESTLRQWGNIIIRRSTTAEAAALGRCRGEGVRRRLREEINDNRSLG